MTETDKPGGLRAVVGEPVTNVRRLIDSKDRPRVYAEAYTIPVAKLLARKPVEVPFLVAGAIPAQNIVLLSGEPGSGKSWIAYELARAVAGGLPWMHRGLTTAQGPVLLLNYDNPTDILAERLRQLKFRSDMPLYIHTHGEVTPPFNGPAVLLLPAEVGKVVYCIEHFRPSLIIVDSLRQSHTMSENDNKEMAMLMGIFKNWRDKYKSTVLLLHHTARRSNEGGWKTESRGSGEIPASADTEIVVSENTMKWTKHRTWNIGSCKETQFIVQDKYLGDDENSDDNESPVEMITEVVATSYLPGEPEYTTMQRILGVLKGAEVGPRKGAFSFTEILDRTKQSAAVVKPALMRAQMLGLIQRVHTRGLRGYALA